MISHSICFCSLFYQVLLTPYFSLGFRLNRYDIAIGSNYIMLTFSSFLWIPRDCLACDAARNTIIIIHFYSSVQSLIVIAVLLSSHDYVLLCAFNSLLAICY